jgi:hypothetical protein
MLLKKTILLICALIFSFTSCMKDNFTAEGVYVSDFYHGRYWKNGVAHMIDVDPCEMFSIFVSGNDVYTAGYGGSGAGGRSRYWKNGKATSVPQGQLSSILVSGGDVYAAGYFDVDGYTTRPFYVKNSTPVTLDTLSGWAKSIYVAGQDVYVAGFVIDPNAAPIAGQNTVAKYWKNGIGLNLANPGSYASAIVVSGEDVYVAGFGNNGATYWKNGTDTPLAFNNTPSTVGVTSIAVSGADIYVTGEVDGIATYWKNGVPVSLSPSMSGMASSITISKKGDVYVSGYVVQIVKNGNYPDSFAALWKNNDLTILGDSHSQGSCVFLAE